MLHRRAVIDGRSARLIELRLMLHRRAVIDGRSARLIELWFMLHRRTVIDGRPADVVVKVRLVHHGGFATGMMPCREPRRTTYAVNMPRVVPMPTIPTRRSPARHTTTGGQSSKAEHRYTAGRIPIHRLPVRVPENRKSVHIIPGIGPRHRGAPPIPAHAYRCARIQRIIVHNARTEPHCSQCRCCQNCYLVFHHRKRVRLCS